MCRSMSSLECSDVNRSMTFSTVMGLGASVDAMAGRGEGKVGASHVPGPSTARRRPEARKGRASATL